MYKVAQLIRVRAVRKITSVEISSASVEYVREQWDHMRNCVKVINRK